jgi:hypothetical protein
MCLCIAFGKQNKRTESSFSPESYIYLRININSFKNTFFLSSFPKACKDFATTLRTLLLIFISKDFNLFIIRIGQWWWLLFAPVYLLIHA